VGGGTGGGGDGAGGSDGGGGFGGVEGGWGGEGGNTLAETVKGSTFVTWALQAASPGWHSMARAESDWIDTLKATVRFAPGHDSCMASTGLELLEPRSAAKFGRKRVVASLVSLASIETARRTQSDELCSRRPVGSAGGGASGGGKGGVGGDGDEDGGGEGDGGGGEGDGGEGDGGGGEGGGGGRGAGGGEGAGDAVTVPTACVVPEAGLDWVTAPTDAAGIAIVIVTVVVVAPSRREDTLTSFALVTSCASAFVDV